LFKDQTIFFSLLFSFILTHLFLTIKSWSVIFSRCHNCLFSQFFFVLCKFIFMSLQEAKKWSSAIHFHYCCFTFDS
jgi:hypothetical protein